MWITDWTTRAACKGTDPDELFVQGAAQNRAKLLCRGCPVRTECLADALDNGIEIAVVTVQHDSVGVDVPGDVARVEKLLKM